MLAINTAFMTANLALQTKNGNFFKDIDAKSKHSENVLKTIDELCIDAQIDISKIKVISVVLGPGSFTGLRIGTAIAQALGCFNKNLKYVGVSSLELMAYNIVKNALNHNKEFYCVINALSDLFFVAKFDKEGNVLNEQKMLNKDEFLALDGQIFALDGDLPKYDLMTIEITSEDLLEFSNKKASNGDFLAIDQMLPVYLRASQAEDNLKC